MSSDSDSDTGSDSDSSAIEEEHPFYNGFTKTNQTAVLSNANMTYQCPIWHGMDPDTDEELTNTKFYLYPANGTYYFIADSDISQDKLFATDAKFVVWTTEGTWTDDLPKALTKGKTRHYDATAHRSSVLNTIEKAANAKLTQTYSIYSRFLNPKTSGPFNIYFVITDAAVKSEIFKEALESLKSKSPHLVANLCTLEEAADKKCIQIGHNFFNLYDTYMPPEDYVLMLNSTTHGGKVFTNSAGSNPWLRPWPDKLDAGIAEGKMLDLHIVSEHGGQTPQAEKLVWSQVTKKKIMLTPKKRSQTQASAMGGCSATEIATFWKADQFSPPGSRPVDAEWLHRCAWSYGGLAINESVSSSQQFKNLCFGTSECNTDMLRTENAIKRLVTRGQDAQATVVNTWAKPSKFTRLNIENMDYEVPILDGSRKELIEQRKPSYGWLIPILHYEANIQIQGRGSNYSINFDTFSRYRPLLLEALIDDFLLDQLIPQEHKKKTKQLHSIQAFALHQTTLTDDPIQGLSTTVESHPDDLFLVNFDIPNPQIHDGPLPQPTSMSNNSSTNTSFGHPISPSPENGFVRTDSVSLFGLSSVSIQLYQYQGPVPTTIDLPAGEKVVFEMGVLSESLRLSTILPETAGSLFDAFSLSNVVFTNQNCLLDKTKGVGWNINATLAIDPSAGSLHDTLSNVLGVPNPTVQLHCCFGPSSSQSWEKALTVSTFTLDGTIQLDHTIGLGDDLKLTEIGIRLFGIRSQDDFSKPAGLSFDWEVFGEMAITVPSSVAPLKFDFSIRDGGGALALNCLLQGDIWDNALGISGLTLSEVHLFAQLALSHPLQNFEFKIRASLETESTHVSFDGSYASGGDFTLDASWTDFDIYDLEEIFAHLSPQDSATSPDVDIHFGATKIKISNSSGLTITLDEVTVDQKYTVNNALIHIHDDGAELEGSFTSDATLMDGVILRKAQMKIDFQRSSSTTASSILMSGEVSFPVLGSSVDVAVSTYIFRKSVKATEGKPDASSVEWILCGSLTNEGGSWPLKNLLGASCPSFLQGVGLQEVVVVAASCDKPDLEAFAIPQCTILKGIQLCAFFDEINQVKDVLRGSVPGLVLQAGWLADSGLTLSIDLPAPESISFGHGISTTPIYLRIETKPTVQFQLGAGLNVPVLKQAKPLDFELQLAINEKMAGATALMNGTWNNPLGVCSSLAVKNVGLDIGINYDEFLETGLPTTFGLKGTVILQKAEAKLVLEIGDDPTNELVNLDVTNLDLNEIVYLANQLLTTKIPSFPKVIVFDDLRLYASPDGATFANKVYPAGFSASTKMTIFSVKADADVTLNSSGFKIKADVSPIKIGVIEVKGWDSSKAKVNIEFDDKKKSVYIDGAIYALDSSFGVHVTFYPSPLKFTFDIYLRFFGEFNLSLVASMKTTPASFDNVDLETLKFSIRATFDDTLRDHTREHLLGHYDLLKSKRRYAGVDADDVVKTRSAKVHSTALTLNAKKDKIRKAHTAYQQTLSSLTAQAVSARETHGKAVSKAEAKVSEAKRKRAAAEIEIPHRQKKVQLDGQKKVAASQRDLRWARENMRRKYHDPSLEDISSNAQQIETLRQTSSRLSLEIENLSKSPLPWHKASLERLYSVQKATEVKIEATSAERTTSKGVQAQPEYIKCRTAILYRQQTLLDATLSAQTAVSKEKQSGDQTRAARDAEIQDAIAQLAKTKEGVTYNDIQKADNAIAVHRLTYPAELTPLGDFKDVATWPERLAYTTACDEYNLGKDLQSACKAESRSIAFLAGKAKDDITHVLHWFEKGWDDFEKDFLEIKYVTMSGDLEAMTNADSVTVEAEVGMRICGHDESFKVYVHLDDHHGFVHKIFMEVYRIAETLGGPKWEEKVYNGASVLWPFLPLFK